MTFNEPLAATSQAVAYTYFRRDESQARRCGRDRSKRFPRIREALASLRALSATIDGEAAVLRPEDGPLAIRPAAFRSVRSRCPAKQAEPIWPHSNLAAQREPH